MFPSIINKPWRNAWALFLTLTFLFISCDSLFNDSIQEEEEGETASFHALDSRGSTTYAYTLSAVKLVEGTHCVVWRAAAAKNVNRDTAEIIAARFDDVIFPRVAGAFGQSDTYSLDGEKKLDILLLDILDNYGTDSKSYIAGYFSENDISGAYPAISNNRSIIYIDTYPGLASVGPAAMQSLYTTIAHEFTHFLTYTIGREKRLGASQDRNRWVWVDEGLAAAAEQIYTGNNAAEKIAHFNHANQYYLENHRFNAQSKITQGNNFFTWTPSQYVLDEYATVYLFFQWLRIQAGNTQIFRDIIASPYADYRAVTSAAEKHIHPSLNSWEKLLETWLWANRLNSKSGLYGYKDQLNLVTAGISMEKTMDLAPGEGVYSNLSGTQFNPPLPSEISYTGMSQDGSSIAVEPPYSDGDTLLTFNGSDSQNSVALSGGEGDPWVAASSSSGRSAAADLKPFPIDRVFYDSDVALLESRPDSGEPH